MTGLLQPVSPFRHLGSMDICSSPKLFAAYHVFHRLLVPRHPPYALSLLYPNCRFITFVGDAFDSRDVLVSDRFFSGCFSLFNCLTKLPRCLDFFINFSIFNMIFQGTF